MKQGTTVLQVRGIPVSLRDRLRRKAKRQNRSMSQYVIDLIAADVRSPTLDEWLAEVRSGPRTHLDIPAAQALHEARAEESPDR
ncbi:MAG TPA: hypothetical protein VF998_08190 [Candidatus Limnocylindria bacterium]